jgi:cytochrome c553
MRATSRVLMGGAGLALLLAVGATGAAGFVDAPGYPVAFACSACHGPGGQSRADSMPILAGMWPEYFRKAIQDYASGRRPSAEMEPFARMVMAVGQDAVAAYFASQPFRPTPVPVDAAAAARGRAAAAPCVACHGPVGEGDRARLVPPLRGQPAGYLREQILLFRDGARSPEDPAVRAAKALMRDLPEAAVDDLAAYYASLR